MIIGLIPGSFKPFHRGHYNMIKQAMQVCDTIKLFVSLKTRSRPGEPSITSELSLAYWEDFLIPNMPNKVKVVFSAVTPITDVYNTLNDAEAMASKTGLMPNTYIVFGDEGDLASNYNKAKQKRLWPTLLAKQAIMFKPVPRDLTGGISGTQMRTYLKLGLEDEFIANLPEIVQSQGHAIWQLFIGENK